MKAQLWRFVARLLARPRVMSWVVALAMRHPYLHLGGYMRRWWLMPRWALRRTPSGYWEVKPWVPFSIRIHHILREDRDPFLHDHPFAWRTCLLAGWYIEEDVFGAKTLRCRGDTRLAHAETFHRIDRVSKSGVWTLFIMGRRTNSWGFMVGSPPRKVHHDDYHSPNDRSAPDGGEAA